MKKKIKKEVMARRECLPRKELLAKSEAIRKRLFALPEFEKARTILFYASIRCEVATEEMIREALALEKTVALPVTDRKKHELAISRIRSLEELSPGAFGVPEPKEIEPVQPHEVELAVIPGIAFDEKGGRLGYGMGYYDKLLAKMRCPLVALAFECQIVPSIPREKHDVDVHAVVTEERVIRCKQF